MNKARMTIRFDHDPPKDSHKDHMREERIRIKTSRKAQ